MISGPSSVIPCAFQPFGVSAFQLFSFSAFSLLAFLFLPTRLVQEANPEWRLVSWALAIEVIGLTLLTIHLGRGRWEGGGGRGEDGGQRTEDGGQRTEGGGASSISSLPSSLSSLLSPLFL